MRYRSRFLTGLGIAFLVALLNGLSLTAFYPLFDALGDQGERFYIQLSKHERKLLQKAVLLHFYRVELPEHLTGKQLSSQDWKLYRIPDVPEKIREEQAKAVLDALKDPPASHFAAIDRIHLITIIKWKLKINEGDLYRSACRFSDLSAPSCFSSGERAFDSRNRIYGHPGSAP
jgi:hypothetical protein